MAVLVEVACHLECGVHRRASGPSHEDPLAAGHGARRQERFAVGDAHPSIDHGGIEGLGPEVLADPFGQVGPRLVAGVHGPLGVGAHDRDVGVHPLQVAADARDGAARPDARHEDVDAAVGLLPDLGPGGFLVGPGVLLVEVLVRLERARDLRRQAVRHRVVGLGRPARHRRGCDHDLRTVGAQQRDLLLAHLVGHHEDAPVPADRRRDRETVARVAGGRFHDRAAGTETALAFGRLEHADPDPVLHGSARVEHLELGEDRQAARRGTPRGAARAACSPWRRGTCHAPASGVPPPARSRPCGAHRATASGSMTADRRARRPGDRIGTVLFGGLTSGG